MQLVDRQMEIPAGAGEAHASAFPRLWLHRRARAAVWWNADAACLSVLMALVVLVGWVRLWWRGVYADWDVVTFYLPWYTFLGQHVRHFDVPGWNPHVFSGMPFAADPQSGWDYLPAMVIFALLPPLTAFKVFVLFHLLLGATASYVFVRLLGFRPLASFAGAAVFTFTGTFGATGCCMIQAELVVWIPVALIGIELAARSDAWRSRFLALSLSALAISQMLAGWVGQGTFYGLLLVASYLGFRVIIMPPSDGAADSRRVLTSAVDGSFLFVIGFGLGAAALIPRLEAVGRTTVGTSGYQQVDCGPLCGYDWWTALRLTVNFNSWWFPYYIGGAGLACASIGILAVSRRRILIYFLALTWVILVLPMHPSTITRLLFLIPRFEGLHAHDPGRVLGLLPAGIAVLVAAAVEEFPRIIRSRWALALPLGLRAIWWFFVLSVPLADRPVATFTGCAFLAIALLVLCGAILRPRRLAAGRWADILCERVLPVLLVLVVLWDPAGYVTIRAIRHPGEGMPAQQPVEASAAADDPGGAGEFLQKQMTSGRPFRYYGFVSPPDSSWATHEHYPDSLGLLVNNRAMLLGLDDVQGYNPAHLVRYQQFFAGMNGRWRDYHEELVYSSGLSSPLLDLLNVRYIIVPNNALTDPARDNSHLLTGRYRQVFANGKVIVLENPKAMPRAWIVHSVEQVSEADARHLLASGKVDPAAKALVEVEPPALDRLPENAGESVTVTSQDGDNVALEVTVASTGMVVLSEIYDPGWRAFVDSHPVQLYRADSILRGVVVPLGHHNVVLEFKPNSLHSGLMTTSLALVVVLLVTSWWFASWYKQEHRARRMAL